MAKKTKRARKFESSGGVKARLQKGTITKKGKFKRKPRPEKDEPSKKKSKLEKSSYNEEIQQKRKEDDFTSQKNLGSLDIDSFFSSFAEEISDADVDQDDAVSDNEESEELEKYETEELIADETDEKADEEDDDEDAEDNDEDAEDAGCDYDDDMEEEPSSKAEIKNVDQKPSAIGKSVSTRHDSDNGPNDDSVKDSDSDEEDIEAAEQRMKKEIGRFQKEDPEFHQFLKENEQSLLDYGEDAEDDDDDDDEDDNGLDRTNHVKKTSDDAEAAEETMSRSLIILSLDGLEKLEHGAFTSHGLKALKKFVNAYKSACHMSDITGDLKRKSSTYHIDNPAVFDRVMVTALNRCHEEFHYHLLGKGSTSSPPLHEKKDKGHVQPDENPEENTDSGIIQEEKPLNPKTLEKSRRWSEAKPILFGFLKSSFHILSEAKEPDLVTFVLKALSMYVPLLAPFPKLAESALKALTTLWSAPIDASEDYQVVRLHSFLRIRQMALTQPFPFIEECLKKLYLAYAQRAKFATASSVTSALPTLTFMGNCVVELYSLDYHSSYQHAFVYIRQLALHLRTAMQKKSTDAFGAVYCWQYLHCLKLWVAVLTEACRCAEVDSTGEQQVLRSLLFPLSQVILGTVRLIPSARYLPWRLHCVRLLQQLAAAAEVFLPTTSILFDVFELKELSLSTKKVEKSNVQPLALTFRLKATEPLRTMEELEMCVSEVFVLFNREVDLYQYSAGFPEFAVRICQRLRKVRKFV